jgi:hypothetical protein
MLDVNEPVIAVLGGSTREIAQWKDANIISIANPQQLNAIFGLEFTETYEIGTWHKWASLDMLTHFHSKSVRR